MGGSEHHNRGADRRSVFGHMGRAVGGAESAGRAHGAGESGGSGGPGAAGGVRQRIRVRGATGASGGGEYLDDPSGQNSTEYAGVLQRSIFPAIFRESVRRTVAATNRERTQPWLRRNHQFGWLHTDEQSRGGTRQRHPGAVEQQELHRQSGWN